MLLFLLACDPSLSVSHDGLAVDADTGLGPLSEGLSLARGTQGTTTSDAMPAGPGTGARLGSSLLLLGDGDGDGLPDVLAAGLAETAQDRLDGGAWLSRGHGYGRGSVASSADLELEGAAGSLTGWAMCRGDLDGDGQQDLALGAPQHSASAPWAGALFVVPEASLGGGSINAFATAKVTGQEHHDRLGQALACGDVDGDGFTDLLVGAPGRDKGSTADAGVTYLLTGPLSAGTSLTGAVQLGGRWPFDRSGQSLLAADLDGDGFEDVVLGNPSEGTGGAVYVVRGSTSPASVRLWSADHRLQESKPDAEAGASLAVGDLDADGYVDLVVGAPGRSDSGEVLGIYGPLPSSMQLASADFRWRGLASGDRFGQSLALVDLDADGGADLVVGSPLSGDGDSGSVFVFLGAASGTSTAWSADARVRGAQDGDFLGRSLAATEASVESSGLLAIGAPGGAKGDKGLVVLYEIP